MNNLELLTKKINDFSIEEHKEILKIILKQKDIKYSENKNGIFIYMEQLNNDIINNIEKYVNYVLKKEEDINNIENKINEIKKKF